MAAQRQIMFQGRLVTATVIDFEMKAEPWAIYELSDGTDIRVKCPVQRILRLEGEYNPDGEPIYLVSTGALIFNAVAKAEMLRQNLHAPIAMATVVQPMRSLSQEQVIDLSGSTFTGDGDGSVREISAAVRDYYDKNTRLPEAILIDNMAALCAAVSYPDTNKVKLINMYHVGLCGGADIPVIDTSRSS